MSSDLRALAFGRWLKKRRDEVGLTQAEVAEKIGYDTAQFISNWERAISLPPIAVYASLVRHYKIRKDEAAAKFREVKMIPVERDVEKLKKAMA